MIFLASTVSLKYEPIIETNKETLLSHLLASLYSIFEEKGHKLVVKFTKRFYWVLDFIEWAAERGDNRQAMVQIPHPASVFFASFSVINTLLFCPCFFYLKHKVQTSTVHKGHFWRKISTRYKMVTLHSFALSLSNVDLLHCQWKKETPSGTTPCSCLAFEDPGRESSNFTM